MSSGLSPKFGRVQFDSLENMASRIRLVEGFFGEAFFFSIYGNDDAGRIHYGLSVSNLENGSPALKSLTATCSDEAGNSVTITATRKEAYTARYAITARSKVTQRELVDRLLGIWTALSAEETAKRELIGDLVRSLRQHLREHELTERMAAMIPIYSRETEPSASASALNLSVDKYPMLYDTFPFDHQVAPEVIIHLLEQLKHYFFQNQDFYFRVVTKEGDPYGDIGIEGVKDHLFHHRDQIKRLYVEVHTSRHEWLMLQLDFGFHAEDHRTELEVSSRRNKQIQATIRDTLEISSSPTQQEEVMIHELFGFDPTSFQIDKVVKLLKTLQERYLDQEIVNGFLSTQQGETFSGVRLKKLRQLYHKYGSEVSFILLSVNQIELEYTYSLMFQFGGLGLSPHGSLSMMWGSHLTHQAIRALTFSELDLGPYRSRSVPNQLQATSKKEMNLTPSFKGRTFNHQPRTALVLMTREAYWSDSIWELLQHQLERSGYSSYRSGAIFETGMREEIWKRLNEVDLVIADLTYKHPSVFYFLGVAHSIGVRTILLSQLDRDVPSDFSDLPVIMYDNNLHGIQHLQEELERVVKQK